MEEGEHDETKLNSLNVVNLLNQKKIEIKRVCESPHFNIKGFYSHKGSPKMERVK